jgi:hypothetical protein
LPNAARGAHYPEMMAHRTTNTEMMESRASRFCRLAALLLGAFGASLAAASGTHDNDIHLRLASASPYPVQWAADLVIEGTWGSSCLPSVTRTSLVDDRIDIQLHSAASHCAATPTPFQIKVNPARDSGLRQLALGVYQVRLFLQKGDGNSSLVAFRLLLSGGNDTRSLPESGFWWSVPVLDDGPALAGNGLSIEQQGDKLAVTWLSYEAGNPVWYFGSTTMPGNIAHVELLRMIGGGEAFSGPNAAPAAEPGLSLNLQFLSPSHANAWLTRAPSPGSESIEVQTLNLLRLPFESGHPGANWQGEWAFVVDNAAEARIVNLANLATADAESFRVSDSLGSVSLHCRLDSIGEHPLPAFCTLSDGASILADFDQVGLDRLSGLTPDGNRVRLVRLPR